MDKTDEVPARRGRPKKQDVVSPIGQYQIDQAKEFHENRDRNPVIEKYWLLNGFKLCFIKKKKSGRTISEYVGSIEDRKSAPPEYKKRRLELLEVIKKKEAEGKLKRV